MPKFIALLLVALLTGLGSVTIRADGELSRAESKLAAAQMNSVVWENTPLREVARQIGRSAGISILTDNRHIDVNTAVNLELANLSALNVLELVLIQTGFVRQLRGGVIWITSKDRAEANPRLLTRTYDVRDLTMPIQDFPAPDMGLGSDRTPQTLVPEREEPTTTEDLIDLIETSVSPEKWGSNGYSIREFKGTLIVSATAEMHRAIRRLLAQL